MCNTLKQIWRLPAIIYLLALSLGLQAAETQTLQEAAELELDSAVASALNNNPSLAEMQARYQALAEVPEQAAALPDPSLHLNFMNLPTDSFDLDQEAMTQVQIGVTQAVPFPGKRSLRKEAAELTAEAAAHSVEEMRLRLIANVRTSWWQLYYLDRALETVDANRSLLRQFIEVATTKYETGKGLQQDVLLAQLELSKLMDREIQLRAIHRNQAIRLNILMDRLPNEELMLPKQINKGLPKAATEEILYRQAQALRPLLQQQEKQMAGAKSRLALAKRDYYPDFKLGLTYGDRRGDNPLPRGGSRSDFLSLMIGVEIPLYAGSKQSKAVRQRSSELQQSRYALLDEKASVMAEISAAVTDYRRAQDQYQLFDRGIVPQARQTVESMLAGYQVNQVDFLNLVRSQITLFNYELQYWQAFSEAKKALARLEAAVGEDSIYE